MPLLQSSLYSLREMRISIEKSILSEEEWNTTQFGQFNDEKTVTYNTGMCNFPSREQRREEVSKRKSRVWPTFGLTSSEVLKHTVLLVSQNDSHFIISLKDIIIESIYGWRWWGRRLLRCKKMQFCSFDPCSSSAARCKFHQLQQQRQLATILESCKFPRTIAELLSSLILFSTAPLRDAFLQEFGIYAKKSKDFWQPVHTFYLTSF